MKSALPLALATLLAACSQAESTASDAPAPPPIPAAPAPTVQAFKFEEKTDLVEIEYSYPAEAAAVPALVDRFAKELADIRAELTSSASEDRAMRQKAGYPFHAYSSQTEYSTDGQSASLLSLARENSQYTGGAHPNHGTTGLLWDRKAGREISTADLFAAPENRERLLTQPWCDALNAERAKRRGAPVSGDGMFDECPPLTDIAIIPADENGNGRFETLELIASPYVAGPYAEGSYEIDLAVTEELLAALKEGYGTDFEITPPSAQ